MVRTPLPSAATSGAGSRSGGTRCRGPGAAVGEKWPTETHAVRTRRHTLAPAGGGRWMCPAGSRAEPLAYGAVCGPRSGVLGPRKARWTVGYRVQALAPACGGPLRGDRTGPRRDGAEPARTRSPPVPSLRGSLLRRCCSRCTEDHLVGDRHHRTGTVFIPGGGSPSFPGAAPPAAAALPRGSGTRCSTPPWESTHPRIGPAPRQARPASLLGTVRGPSRPQPRGDCSYSPGALAGSRLS